MSDKPATTSEGGPCCPRCGHRLAAECCPVCGDEKGHGVAPAPGGSSCPGCGIGLVAAPCPLGSQGSASSSRGSPVLLAAALALIGFAALCGGGAWIAKALFAPDCGVKGPDLCRVDADCGWGPDKRHFPCRDGRCQRRLANLSCWSEGNAGR